MADRRELVDDPEIALRVSIRGHQAGVWTALPGIITKFDPDKLTCEVQPAIKALILDEKGVKNWVKMPLLVDCPVVFPSGGGFTLTFPLKNGDECLVMFASRCIDSWWQSGGVQVQAELRMHDLSDGFVLPGPRSVPKVPGAVSTTSVQLRNDAGDAYVSIDPDGQMDVVSPVNCNLSGANVNVNASGTILLNAPDIQLVGNVAITGTLDVSGKVQSPVDAEFDSIKISHHHHSGVQNGPSNSGPPLNF